MFNGQLFFSFLDIDPADQKKWKVCLVLNENLLSIMDLINSTILPFFLMTLFSVLTIKAVFDSRSKIRRTVLDPRIAAINANIISSNFDTSRKRDIKFAITSILLNLIFLIFNAPYSSFYFIVRNILNQDGYGWIYVRFILLLSYVNHSSVLFMNLIVNNQFKEEFKLWYSEKISIFKRSFSISI
jgi:hypothetical protein